MIVSNSTPLIGLAKIGRLDLLKDLFGVVFIPPEVKIETVERGEENKSPDAYVIRKTIEEEWIIVEETGFLQGLEEFGIDVGESAAIMLAKKKNSKDVLIDERHARLAAKALGLRPLGIIYVLLSALEKKIISYEEYKKCLDDLVKVNFRLSEEVYNEALSKGKELNK